jgi:hypothetical protein
LKHQEAAAYGSILLGFESERFIFHKKCMWVQTKVLKEPHEEEND